MSSQTQDVSQAGVKLPLKVVVSLRAGLVLALANVVCAGILALAWVQSKAEPKVISVTGSAKKVIESDQIVWNTIVSGSNADLSKAYEETRNGVNKVLAYVRKEGIADSEITVSSVSTYKRRAKDEKGHDTDRVSSFELRQCITVQSRDVRKVEAVERKVTDLIKDGVMLESQSPKYLYTKLAELKITMLAEATKDATTRAQQIASNSGATLGPIRDARMGVMQINAQHADEVSGSGVNDTSSFMKEITAVVSARFALQ